jgi:hypothetical protein
MTDLDKLIAAVEAGSIARHDLDAFIPWRGLDNLTNDCLDAYNGSLDAALRLHEALLPGWNVQRLFGPYRNDPRWRITIKDMDPKGAEESAIADNPARAWLLAILRALKARA